jgi:hypothetical protein
MWIYIQNKLFNLNNATNVFITDKVWEDYEEKELGHWVLKIRFPGKNNIHSFKMNSKNEAQEAFNTIHKSLVSVTTIK